MPVAQSFTRDVDTLITTTWDERRKVVADNAFPIWPALKKFTEAKQESDGGLRIELPIEYYSTATAKNLASDLETIALAKPDPMTYAIFNWIVTADGIVFPKNAISDNMGIHKIFDYVNKLIDNFEHRYMSQLSTNLWAASPASTDPGSIPQYVTVDGTGTVGGIATSNAWWKNKFKTSGSFGTQGLADMRTLFNNCSQGMNAIMPDLAITDQTGFENFEAHMSARERLVIEERGRDRQELGYRFLRFKTMDVIWDAAISSVSTASDGRWYFVNTEYLFLMCEKGRWYDRGPLIEARDQLGKSMLIDSRYNLCVNARRFHGVLSSVTYP